MVNVDNYNTYRKGAFKMRKNPVQMAMVWVLILTMIVPNVVLASPSPAVGQEWLYQQEELLLPLDQLQDFVPIQHEDFHQQRLQEVLTRLNNGEMLTAEEQWLLQENFGIAVHAAFNAFEAFDDDALFCEFTQLIHNAGWNSALTDAQRYTMLSQMHIAREAFGEASQWLQVMEADGYTLPQSVELLQIIASGMFNYEEARQIVASGLQDAFLEFNSFARLFDIAEMVNDNRLVNMPFVPINDFAPRANAAPAMAVDELPAQTWQPGGTYITRVEVVPVSPAALYFEFDYNDVMSDAEFEEFLNLLDDATREMIFNVPSGSAIIIEMTEFLPIIPGLPQEYLPGQEEMPPTRHELFIAATSEAVFEDARAMFLAGQDMGEIMQAVALNAATQASPGAIGADICEDTLTEGMAVMYLGISPTSVTDHQSNVVNPFNLGFNANDSVSLNTGAAMFRDNIVSLPGRNGFGFSLDLVYNSADADLLTPRFGMTWQSNTVGWWDEVWEYVRTHVADRRVYIRWPGFYRPCFITGGIVWQPPMYTFSHWEPIHEYVRTLISREWIEECWGYDWPTHNTTSLRQNPQGLGMGWSFDLPSIQNGNTLHVPGRGTFEFNRFLPPDMTLTWYNGFVHNALRSSRRLTLTDGTRYYFDNSGRIIAMIDRFGNQIRFEYEMVNNFGSVLRRVVDSNGKVITLNYAVSGSSRTITITSPDGGVYTINMSQVQGRNEFQVASVQNQVGAVTAFSYEVRDTRFNLFSRTIDSGTTGWWGTWIPDVPSRSIPVLLLTQVTYPSGAQLRFEYGIHRSSLGDGINHNGTVREIFKVSARELSWNGRAYQRATFMYSGTANPPEHNGNVPAHHIYNVTVTQNNGIITTYTFNNLHLNTLQTVAHNSGVNWAIGRLNTTQTITYNQHRLPATVTLTENFLFQGTNRQRTTTQRFTYNNRGQVTETISPLARGNATPAAHYRTVITHDARFGLPLSTTFYANPTTRVEERNTLSADGRSIIRTEIFENGVRMSRTDFLHDSFGNVTEIREFPDVNNTNHFITTQITFDRGTMPSSIRTGATERRFTYDNMWRVLSETDPNGYTTRFQYDGIGRITRIDLPNGGFVTYAYNDQQNILQHRTILGAMYTYRYDGFGNLLTITDQNGTVILTNVYDNRMRLIETRNAPGLPSSGITTFVYDMFDRVVETRRLTPGGAVLYRETTQFFDVNDAQGNNRVVTTIHGDAAAQSIVSYIERDMFGRVTRDGISSGQFFLYEHDHSGRLVQERGPRTTNSFTHNIFGVTSVRNILGHTARNHYDSMGRLVRASCLMGNYTHFVYDNLGRLTEQRTPFERMGNTTHYSITRYEYDNNSNLTRVATLVNLPGQPQSWAYTVNTFQHNRLMSSTVGGVNGIRTDFTYDLAGNITSQRVGNAVTTFEYNNRGQLTRTTDALGQVEIFTYDANGLLVTHTDRNGTTFRFTHDGMGRVVRQEATRPDFDTIRREWTFTLTGAVRTETEGVHTLTSYYDAAGRLIRQLETGGILREYGYDNTHRVRSHVRINGVIHIMSNYHYNNAGQLIRVLHFNDQTRYYYDANGRIIRRILNNGATTTYTRNLAGLVTSQVTTHGSNTLSRFDYVYYLDGNTSRMTEVMGGITRVVTYTYDQTRRLIREHDTGAGGGVVTRSYFFDNRGNRTRMEVTGAENYTVTNTHDLNNRLLTEVRTGMNPSTTTFTHDRNGNQLTSTSPQLQETREYNLFNQLVRVERTEMPGMSSTATGFAAVAAFAALELGEDMASIDYGFAAFGLFADDFAQTEPQQNIPSNALSDRLRRIADSQALDSSALATPSEARLSISAYDLLAPLDAMFPPPFPVTDKQLSLLAGVLAIGGLLEPCAAQLHFLANNLSWFGHLQHVARQEDRWYDTEYGTIFIWMQHEIEGIWADFHYLASYGQLEPGGGQWGDWTLSIDEYTFYLHNFSLVVDWEQAWNRALLRSGSTEWIFIRVEDHLQDLPTHMFAELIVPLHWLYPSPLPEDSVLSLLAGVLAIGGVEIHSREQLYFLARVLPSFGLVEFFALWHECAWYESAYGTVFRWCIYTIKYVWQDFYDLAAFGNVETFEDGGRFVVNGYVFDLGSTNLFMHKSAALEQVMQHSGCAENVFVLWPEAWEVVPTHMFMELIVPYHIMFPPPSLAPLSLLVGALAVGGVELSDISRLDSLAYRALIMHYLQYLADKEYRWYEFEDGLVFRWEPSELESVWANFSHLATIQGTMASISPGWILWLGEHILIMDEVNMITAWPASWNAVLERSGSSDSIFIRVTDRPEELPTYMRGDMVIPYRVMFPLIDVSFSVGGIVQEGLRQRVEPNGRVSVPVNAPTREGYTLYWYTAATGGVRFDFENLYCEGEMSNFPLKHSDSRIIRSTIKRHSQAEGGCSASKHRYVHGHHPPMYISKIDKANSLPCSIIPDQRIA